jgi:hypothetical protein
MDEHARVGASAEEWRAYQRFKVDLVASGMEAALRLLAAAGSNTHELDRLTHRLAVGFAKLTQRRAATFDEELREVVDGGSAA